MISVKQNMLFECDLCPRRCHAARPFSGGETPLKGVCRAPMQAVVSGMGVHHWEEPVISGTRGSGTLFFAGCNLHCVFCQNHAISTGCEGKACTPKELRDLYFELIGKGVHNINLVTPGHFVLPIAESLAENLPVPVVYNSNGYELPETLQLLENKIQIYLPDLKYADNTLAARYSHAPDYFETAVAAIDEMYRQVGDFAFDENGMLVKGVVIRHLILPGQLENSFKVIEFIAKHFRPGQVLFSLMHQYLPCGLVSEENYPELNRKLNDFEYETVEAALFASGIEDGFVQEADSAESEFIPGFMHSFTNKEA